jgi:hypothetical protein
MMTNRTMNSPVENKPDRLKALQMSFAAHIRDPQGHPPPEGIEDRRMKIYRELFFNNIQSLLAANFPVLRSLYSEEKWHDLIRSFYREHRCQTPLFPEVSKEFLRYLQDVRQTQPEDPGFLLELAHYEWVELALSLDERSPADMNADPAGDLLTGIPLLSPLAWPLSYRYPVHQIRPEFQPALPPEEPTHLLVYRNREDEVKFMHLNNVSRHLLDLIQTNRNDCGMDLLKAVASAIGQADSAQVVTKGSELLNELRQKDVLVGVRR